MLLITRPASGDAWPARLLTSVVFIACEGAQDATMARRLDEAFRRGGSGKVRSLRFGATPSATDWLRATAGRCRPRPRGRRTRRNLADRLPRFPLDCLRWEGRG